VVEVGTKIGRYTVTSLLADGDLAVTWKVEAEGVAYALRLLVLRDQGFSERLRRAAAAQRELHHPNLLRVVDVVEVDGCPGVVTDFVLGRNLDQWIASGPHPPSEVLLLFKQMVSGVRAAHEAGLIHRNLKPSKVLVGRDATGMVQVRISDFLLGKVQVQNNAALTQLGTTFGTPQYMSPEQFRGAANVDERGDLFALGCLLYEMATGRRAFAGTSLLEVYQQVAGCDYLPVDEVRPGLPAWVGRIVGALLQPNPGERVASAAELLELLDEVDPNEAPLGGPAAPAPLRQPTPPPAQTPVLRAPRSLPPPPPEDDDDELRPKRASMPAITVLLLSLGLGLGFGLFVMVVVAVGVWFALHR
jgi:serine/threonine-protein kinase